MKNTNYLNEGALTLLSLGEYQPLDLSLKNSVKNTGSSRLPTISNIPFPKSKSNSQEGNKKENVDKHETY